MKTTGEAIANSVPNGKMKDITGLSNFLAASII